MNQCMTSWIGPIRFTIVFPVSGAAVIYPVWVGIGPVRQCFPSGSALRLHCNWWPSFVVSIWRGQRKSWYEPVNNIYRITNNKLKLGNCLVENILLFLIPFIYSTFRSRYLITVIQLQQECICNFSYGRRRKGKKNANLFHIYYFSANKFVIGLRMYTPLLICAKGL